MTRMTKEEAKEILTHSWTRVDNPNYSESELDEAFFMAIEALKTVQKHEETFEWCTDCNEYDQEQHCCHRWSKCIRESLKDVDIVNCCGCVHFDDERGMCKAWGRKMADFDYCSFGERRE